MGDPKFPRRLYDTPNHPWQLERIMAENEIIRGYGLKNKREVWKAQSVLRRFRRQARTLLAKQATGIPQVELETRQLMGRLRRMGLMDENAKLEDVLGLNLEAVLSRRLQTLVYHKGLASTHTHARQLITHNHIAMGGRIVNVPGFLVGKGQEEAIAYALHSPLVNEAHPMRPKARAPGEAPPERRERRDNRFDRRGPPRGGDRRGGPPPRGPPPQRGPPAQPPSQPAPSQPAPEKAPEPAKEGGA